MQSQLNHIKSPLNPIKSPLNPIKSPHEIRSSHHEIPQISQFNAQASVRADKVWMQPRRPGT